MRIFLILISLVIISCNHTPLMQEDQNVVKAEWDLINKIENEKWTQIKILSYFGEPQKIYKEATDTMIYYDKNKGYQNWAFEINKDGSLISITFIPNILNRVNFTYDEIIQKWGKECTKKIATDLTQHFIKKIYTLECEKNRHANLNRYDEIMSLYIQIK